MRPANKKTDGALLMFTWKEIIHIAVQIEQNGEQTYRFAAEKTNDPQLKEALLHLAEEEARHAKWLSNLAPEGMVPKEATDLEKLTRVFLKDSIADQPFSLGQVDFGDITSLDELLAISLEFEQDTLLFYEMIRDVAPDKQTESIFDNIIAEEERHIIRLSDDFNNMMQTTEST